MHIVDYYISQGHARVTNSVSITRIAHQGFAVLFIIRLLQQAFRFLSRFKRKISITNRCLYGCNVAKLEGYNVTYRSCHLFNVYRNDSELNL